MENFLLFFSMIFFHIIDDYYLQGRLASMKQKSWWQKNYPDLIYKDDYIMALLEHAFSWTFMIHIPCFIYCFVFNKYPNCHEFIIVFLLNWIIHFWIDDLKANQMKINLIQDQTIHILQITFTCLLYVFL